jgi:hypothetical protein
MIACANSEISRIREGVANGAVDGAGWLLPSCPDEREKAAGSKFRRETALIDIEEDCLIQELSGGLFRSILVRMCAAWDCDQARE